METWNAITSRRNVREFSDQPLADEDVARVLEAARRAPSASNKQWWDLILVTDRDRLVELAEVWQGARHVAGARAVVAVIAPTPEDDRQRATIHYDLGQLTMQMMIAAADLGIGTAHAAVRDQDLARRLLGIPDDRLCAWLISMGYPADRPLRPIRNPNRRDFDDVVHRERW
jgi:nitroreductase